MALSVALWAGGMLFSLGAFALKVGFGLGYGRIGIKGIAATLGGYGLLFTALALLTGSLRELLMPLLSRGPYVHIAMAIGLIAWGGYTLLKTGRGGGDSIAADRPHGLSVASLMLIIPCPVCLIAMAFSTWAALSVIPLPAWLVGAGLGLVFAALALLFTGMARARRSRQPEISLGLVLVAIGLYFLASLQIPAKIEEARGVYASLADKGTAVAAGDGIGVLLLLLAALVAGYFMTKKGWLQ
jgi:predicted transporter